MLGAALATWLRSSAAFFRAHLFAMGLMFMAVLCLPGPPRDLLAWPLLLAELVLFALLYTVRAAPDGRGLRASRSTLARPASAAIWLGIALATAPVLAQVPTAGPEPQPVYLLPGSEPGKESALVNPDLLRKLDEMASRPAALPSGAVVVAAQYQGKLKEGLAEIEAGFDLYHFDGKSFIRTAVHRCPAAVRRLPRRRAGLSRGA